ncbi:MAG: LD-carboxypeptidase [Bacilli bacterium]|nr:LD-carboxypeptidase [Bacilli bacterium]
MIYPNDLKISDLIGVTATSSGLIDEFDRERLKKTKENLEKLGYKTIETPNVFTNNKFVSSSGQDRVQEFMKLWKNDDIKAIAQLRGGELLLEMLPYLDDDIIPNNSKWIFGYSDSSLLNFYLTTKYHIATINSGNVLEFAMDKIHESLFSILKCMSEKAIIQENFKLYEGKKHRHEINYSLDTKVKYKSLYNNKEIIIKGRMIGGCLEAIIEILGTKYDYVSDFCNSFKEGMFWYLDIYDSNPLDLYRKLWQMKEAFWFNNINGIIIGRTRSIKKIEDFTYLDALHKIFDDMNIPVIIDVDIGHVKPQFSIINGSFGTFTYKNGKGTLKQEKI